MYSLLKHLLFLLEPESAHSLAKSCAAILPKAFLRPFACGKWERIACHIGDHQLASPVGLAAGFDKNAEMIATLAALGFGFLEIGSITAKPCPGSLLPRLFRLPEDESLINRLGLPGDGVDVIMARLKSQKNSIPLGLNIAKTPASGPQKVGDGLEDQLTTFKKIGHEGAYVVFNLSCPNTDDGRTFEDPAQFQLLAKALVQERRAFKQRRPILFKLSPDLDLQNLKKIVEMAMTEGFDGFVVGNTTASRAGLKTNGKKLAAIGDGGLSGAGLTRLANQQLARVFEITGGKAMLVGVGGIMSFADLLAKLACGANFFQIYTGLIYRGPFFARVLSKKLDHYCKKLGVAHYSELIGQKNLIKNMV